MLVLRWVRRAVLALVLLAVLVVGGTATGVWWTARGDDRTPTDAIVVLGASQFDGRPSSVLEARLEHARTLYQQDVAPVVVTAGGGRPGDRFTEAEAGARYLEQRGVPDVVAVGEGSNTLESLEAVQRLLAERGWSSATIVTDPWHTLRSTQMAEDVGIAEVRASPTRRGPSVRTRGTQLRYIVRETGALLYYEVLGRSAESGPQAV
ncbi:MAG TPA: YdcF family protein [Mycobacteriales bacterium]|nr:YdcF family protein [Mycobacteriales bacterium]